MAPDAQQPVMIVFYLAPTFSLFDFSLAVETLRLANQVLGYADHRWRIASETGVPVRSSCGVPVTSTSSMADEQRYLFNELCPGMVCICSNNVAVGCDIKLSKPWLLSCSNKEVAIGGFGCSWICLMAKPARYIGITWRVLFSNL